MTDYVDGELRPGIRSGIKEHLTGCSGCRALEQALQKKAVEPFKMLKGSRRLALYGKV